MPQSQHFTQTDRGERVYPACVEKEGNAPSVLDINPLSSVQTHTHTVNTLWACNRFDNNPCKTHCSATDVTNYCSFKFWVLDSFDESFKL